MRNLVRTPAFVLSVVLAAGAAATPAAAARSPLPWDHAGYDAENSYYNPHETVITAATVGRLARKWSVKLRTAEDCSGFGAPVVSGGRVFVGDQAGISAYSAATGARAWSFDWDDFGTGWPPRLTVVGRLLIAGYGDCYSVSDPNTHMVALDAATGARRWAGVPPIGDLVVDKGVILASGTDITGETAAAAYRVRDGRELWRVKNRRVAAVSAGGTVVAVATDDEGVRTGESVALDIASGAVRWTTKTYLSADAASPADDAFYGADADGGLAAVGVADGTVRWRAPAPADPNERIATDGARVYRSCLKTVTALDARTGKRLWSRKLANDTGQPRVAGGLVFAGNFALDARRGTVVGRVPAVAGDIVVAGGVLYQAKEGVLSAYAPRPAAAPRP
ncbi:PQQ-binding-like beta-propeller repeat protein [Actinoplanes sp. NPDC026623]|uniref:outer membrane protein assembly factor BamB family protein n=1 Tax=Actinoplanes sp. NPDC026623 TaxID=3155610 RepID=UPI0033D5A7D3